MFKLVIWNNQLSEGLFEKFKDRNDILIITTKDENLKWSELTLPSNVLSNLAENADLVFASHGFDDATCFYNFVNDSGEVTAYRSSDVINEIFKPFILNTNINLHMISCHAGMVLDELVHQTQVNIADGRWLNHSIFLHSGTITIRFLRISEALEIIDNTEHNEQEVSAYRNFNLFEKLQTNTPGDLTYIQIPDFAFKAPLIVSSNFVGHNLPNLPQHLNQDWTQISSKINAFADENNIAHKLAEAKHINLFNYLKNSFKHGADNFYELEFPTWVGVLDGKLENVDDIKVTKFVDDLYSLVEANHLTKAQFDELIAIQYFFHAKKNIFISSGVVFPDGYGFKLTSAHEKLFCKGFDVTQVQYDDLTFIEQLLWSNYPVDAIRATLNMAGIRCSDLNSNNLLNNILYIESSQELLPTIVKRLEQKIDLNAKDSEGTLLIDQIKYSSMFKKHYKLILKNLIRLKVNLRLPMLHGHVEYQNLKS
jgi:hypothetical protein